MEKLMTRRTAFAQILITVLLAIVPGCCSNGGSVVGSRATEDRPERVAHRGPLAQAGAGHRPGAVAQALRVALAAHLVRPEQVA